VIKLPKIFPTPIETPKKESIGIEQAMYLKPKSIKPPVT
jgi:hypothetical protein